MKILSQEFPMHVIDSLKLKNTLIARLQPVSFEINNLLLLLFEDDDDDVDVLATGLCDDLCMSNKRKRK